MMRAALVASLVIGAAAIHLSDPVQVVPADAHQNKLFPEQKKDIDLAKQTKPQNKPTDAPVAPVENPGKAIFYSVIMGTKYTRRHQVSLWLNSLRNAQMGNFGGEAIIVTDKAACLAKTLEETKMLGAKDHWASNEKVDVYGPPEGLKGNIYIVKRPHTGNIMKMKLEKARTWINTRRSGIEGPIGSVIYTDEDVVIGKDVKNFLFYVRQLIPDNHTLAVFKDTGRSRGELHTGVVVMYNTTHTEKCLHGWGKTLTGLDVVEMARMETRQSSPSKASLKVKKPSWTDALGPNADDDDSSTDPLKLAATDAEEMEAGGEEGLELQKEKLMGPDQQALGMTKMCMAAPGHQGIHILPASFFWFPDSGGMNGPTPHRAEFIHFTNTGRWARMSRENIGKYLKAIGVPKHIDPMGFSESEQCVAVFNSGPNGTHSANWNPR